MSKKPLILGIESSCDETAASIITENEQGIPLVLSNIVSSQVDVHKEFGGVVPELAARSHMEKIDWIVQKAIDDSGRKIEEIDAVASTAGPGLIVCLSVGLSFGKAFASALDKPFIAVNHLEGHALSPKLNSKLNYPYLLLLISGGHSQYLNVQGLGKYKRLGTTIDDALGEAFDKTAKLLGVEFPGGPQIEILAEKGDPNKYDLPKPIFNKGGCNLSFAGLKTAILRITKNIKTDQEKFDLAASFQKTVEQILYKKTKIAFAEFEKQNDLKEKVFVVAGGVAAIIAQPEIVNQLSGITDNYFMSSYMTFFNTIAGESSIETGSAAVNDLLSTGGMSGMLNTIWLVICSMCFGGAMEVTGMLKKITSSFISKVESAGSLIAKTAGTCIFFNATTSDQYLAIVVPGKMFSKEFKNRGLKPENLSRTLEDSGTVTSPLIPWNTCGAYHAGVLGVATGTYWMFCFFNLISPIMTVLYGFLNIRIRRYSKEEMQAIKSGEVTPD